jgi:flagella basal body P-ring formation protein FlgA
VTAEAVRVAATEAVRAYAAANKLDIETEIPHARGMEVAGAGVPTLRASLPVKEVRGTSVPVRMEVLNGSEEVLCTMHLVARVRVFAGAAVAARDIARGDSLASGDIVMKRVEIGGVREYYTSPERLAGVRAKAVIRAGTILCASNVRQAPLVRRGDRVTMKAVVGAVEVSSEGTARQDGGRGECIRVYNEMTRSTALCRILDSHTVQVGKGGG